MRAVHVEPPSELSTRDGLAYALFLPDGDAQGGVVMVHGAGSQKENQFDVARALRAAGVAAVCFDQRGHGESEGALGADALDDIAAMATLLPPGPVALRGSSMGGFMALMASTRMDVAAVVAVCPASGELLARGLRDGRFSFRADHDGLHRAARAGRRAGGGRARSASGCCSCTPRATSRCRSACRASCTRARPAAAWSRCRAVITARSSTTPS